MTQSPQAILDPVERFARNVAPDPQLVDAKTPRLRTPMAKEWLQRQTSS